MQSKLLLRLSATRVLVVVMLLTVFFAWIAGGLSGRQPQTVTMDVGVSLGRLLFCITSLFWLQELFSKPIESKYISQYLAQPRPRYIYVLQSFASIALLLPGFITAFALLLATAISFGVDFNQQWPPSLGIQYALSWIYIYLDILVVVSFAYIVSVVSTTPYLSLVSGFGFYVIAHSIGPVITYLSLVESVVPEQKNYIQPLLEGVTLFIPDLRVLDVRDWTLYSEPVNGGVGFKALGVGLAYMTLYLWLATTAFNRRDFS